MAKKKSSGGGGGSSGTFTPSPTAVEGGTTKGPKNSPSTNNVTGTSAPSGVPSAVSHSGSSGVRGNSGYSAPAPSYPTPVSSGSSYYAPPKRTYNPPPTYAELMTERLIAPTSIFQDLFGGGVKKPRNRADELRKLLSQPLSNKKPTVEFGEQEELSPKMREFLESLREQDKAPEGWVPGANKIDEEGEFAWVPKRFRYTKNGDLKPQWDLDFITSAETRNDYMFPSQFQSFLTDQMDAQYGDREKWLQQKNKNWIERRTELLDDAGQAAYDGDYDYLDQFLEDHPNFSFDAPDYAEQFGISPEEIRERWKQERGSIEDPYMRSSMAYRTSRMVKHYMNLREGKYYSYQKINRSIEDAIARYEDKYGDAVDFGLDAGGDREEAAEAAGPAMPRSQSKSAKEQALVDEVGEYADPREDFPFLDFYGAKPSATDRAANRNAVQAAQAKAKVDLRTSDLPSVKQMLSVDVSNGVLDPRDEDAVAAAIDRYRNPNHPDTRAMYVSWAMMKNPEFDKDSGLKYINDPVVQYNKEMEARAQAQKDWEEGEAERKLSDVGLGFLTGDPIVGDSSVDNAENMVGWTVDKLSRLSYGMAGMADAWYSIDQDKYDIAWTRQFDPLSALMGAPTFGALDEIWNDPSKLAEPFKAGYQQTFRGSGLPGTSDDLVPKTFSTVIANNALRDPENNIYDEEWYQHTAGFLADVAFDPLNLVGVGVVSNTLKVPARLTKAAKAASKSEDPNIEIVDFLNRVVAGDRSPIAEKVFKVDQAVRRLGDDVSGQHYVDDAELFRPDGITAGAIPTMRSINRELYELNVQQTKIRNDLGIDVLRDELKGTNSALLALPLRDPGTRVSDLMKYGSRIGKYGVDNPGGKFFEGWLDVAQNTAKAQMGKYSNTVYTDTEFGEVAKRLDADENNLRNAIDRGEYDEASPGVQKKLDEIAAERDKLYGAGWRQEADLKAYFDDGAPGFKPTFDPAAAIAKSMGMERKDFDAITSPEDIQNALINGPRMYTESDSAAAAQYFEGTERIVEAKKILDDPYASASRKRVAKTALAVGYKMRSEVTIGGMLRYLDTLWDMRRTGGGDFINRLDSHAKMNQLTALRQQVRERLEDYPEVDFQGAGGEGDYIGGFEYMPDGGLPGRGSNYEGEDFTDKSIEDLLAESRGHKNPRDQLLAIDKELQYQIDEVDQALNKSDEITGLPPTVAYRVEKIVPADSILRKSAGEDLNITKIKSFIKPVEKHTIGYDGNALRAAGGTADDFEFFDILTKAMQREYDKTWRALKTEKVDPKANEPGPAEKALGPRPTGATLKERFPTLYKPENRVKRYDSEGNELGPGEREVEYVTFEGFRIDGEREVIVTKGNMSVEDAARYERSYKTIKDGEKELKKNPGSAVGGKIEAARQEIRALGLKYNEVVKMDNIVPNAVKKKEVIEGGGSKRRNQEGREKWVARKQREYDKALLAARIKDSKRPNTQHQLTPEQSKEITKQAEKQAVNSVLKSVEDAKELPQVPGNVRATINQQAKILRDKERLRYEAEDIKLRLEQQEALGVERLGEIKIRRQALVKEHREVMAHIEAAREKAHLAREEAKRIVELDHILQIADAPPRATARMLQLRIMGMRKNLQFSRNLFRGAEVAEKILPAKWMEKYVNFFVRPTKQLDARETQLMWAQLTSKTPFIIKAHLERINHRYRDIPEAERPAMFKAYRDNTPYEGPHMDRFDAAMAEIREIEDIFNGRAEAYWFKPRRGQHKPQPVTIGEIYRYIPTEYQPNMKVLNRLMRQDGGITADNFIKAVKANPEASVAKLLDPFTFSWSMRLAADQARQLKAIKHGLEDIFGVYLPQNISAEKTRVRTLLNSRHGWKTVDDHTVTLPNGKTQVIRGLDSDVYFPPEIANDIKKLLEFTEPGPTQSKASKLFDQAMGYWKQSMTIYNPGYYTRNGIGEMMVSWLDGVNNPKYYRMAYRVARFRKGTDRNLANLVDRWSMLENANLPIDVVNPGEVLLTLKGGVKVRVEDALREYVNMALGSTFANTDLARGTRALAGSTLAGNKLTRGARKTNEFMHDVGEGFEDYLRMAHFLHAMENSGKTSLAAAARYARERVVRSHFDYSDFSKFEQMAMVRLFPFYKWTRRGAPLMVAHLFMTPGKMAVMPKAFDAASNLGIDPVGIFNDDPVLSTQDVHEDKNGNLPNYRGIAPSWVRDLFAYQMAPAPDDEYGNYFRMSTPQIDGLNALASFAPRDSSSPMAAFGDSAGYPLLNPLLKGAIELGQNQSMDPDFPFPIVGGEYNQMNDINAVEALVSYAAKSTNPIGGFLAKLSKNGHLGPLSMGEDYRDDMDYNASRDVASFGTGLGFYQARGMPTPDSLTTPVGKYDLSDLPAIRGRKAAGDSSDGPSGSYGQGGRVGSAANYTGYGSGDGSNGWVDYPDYGGSSGWVNYFTSGSTSGYGGYGSGGSGSGGSSGYSGGSVSSGSGTDFWALLQQLKAMIDQGEVYDG